MHPDSSCRSLPHLKQTPTPYAHALQIPVYDYVGSRRLGETTHLAAGAADVVFFDGILALYDKRVSGPERPDS